MSLSRQTLTRSALAFAFAALSQPLLAQDANKTTFWIDHDILRWTSDTSKPQTGSTEKSNGLVTTPNDVTIGIFWKEFGLYVTPGAAGGTVGGSYYFTPAVEVGLNLGFNNSETKNVGGGADKTESQSSIIGLFGKYYHTISQTQSAEFGLTVNTFASDSESTTNGVKTKNADESGTSITILAQYVHQISNNFSVVPGLSYTQTNGDDDVANSDIEKTGLAINIAHFRYIF